MLAMARQRRSRVCARIGVATTGAGLAFAAGARAASASSSVSLMLSKVKGAVTVPFGKGAKVTGYWNCANAYP
jgi:hypothetical protein